MERRHTAKPRYGNLSRLRIAFEHHRSQQRNRYIAQLATPANGYASRRNDTRGGREQQHVESRGGLR